MLHVLTALFNSLVRQGNIYSFTYADRYVHALSYCYCFFLLRVFCACCCHCCKSYQHYVLCYIAYSICCFIILISIYLLAVVIVPFLPLFEPTYVCKLRMKLELVRPAHSSLPCLKSCSISIEWHATWLSIFSVNIIGAQSEISICVCFKIQYVVGVCGCRWKKLNKH